MGVGLGYGHGYGQDEVGFSQKPKKLIYLVAAVNGAMHVKSVKMNYDVAEG